MGPTYRGHGRQVEAGRRADDDPDGGGTAGMTPLARVLGGARRPRGRGSLAKVVFVSYGTFDCNSAGHIAGFAGELKRQGYAVAVCARPPASAAYAFGPPAFEFFSLQDLGDDPEGVIGFDGVLDFDKAVRDPDHPAAFRDGYHAGDHLHGSDKGYTAMANAIDLKLFN